MAKADTEIVLHHVPTMEAAEKRRDAFVNATLDRRVSLGGQMSVMQIRKLIESAHRAGFSDGVETTLTRLGAMLTEG